MIPAISHCDEDSIFEQRHRRSWRDSTGPTTGPMRNLPYATYVPIDAFARTAFHRAEQLREAVEDSFLRFETIWDPVKYIIFPMLQPHIVRETPELAVYEFAGELYFERRKHIPNYANTPFSIAGDRLISHGSERCSAARISTTAVLDAPASWVFIELRDGWALARMRD